MRVENLNCLENPDAEPESDGATDGGKQPADGWSLHLGDCHLHRLGERQNNVAFFSSGPLRHQPGVGCEGVAGHRTV